MDDRIQALAEKVRLIAMDVDGVLTGGEIVVLESGEEVKVWNVRDGFGFHLARRSGAGIRFAWITGRASRQVKERSEEMGIDVLYQSCMKKWEALQEVMQRFDLAAEEVLYIGDDLVDVPVFRHVGLAVSPSDAPDEVRAEADYVSRFGGGRGAVREAIEIVLKARGLWDAATKGYLHE